MILISLTSNSQTHLYKKLPYLCYIVLKNFLFLEISMMQRKLPRDDDNIIELRRLDDKVGSMLKEVTCNFLIVFVMLCVAFISFDENMYLQNANLKSRFVENVEPDVSVHYFY